MSRREPAPHGPGPSVVEDNDDAFSVMIRLAQHDATRLDKTRGCHLAQNK